PVQHAVMAGDDVTGACTFLIEEGLDSGPVYGCVTDDVRPTDTSGDLLERLSRSGARLLVATMDGIEDASLVAVPQPPDGVSLAPKVMVADARVEWTAPAMRVDRVVRGCTPAPGAWTLFRGERLKLAPVRLRAGDTALAPGEIAVERKAVRVGTGSHAVELTEVQPQGKRLMAAVDWARGVRPEAGERFGEPAATA
ncbi:methionyl-tRNA formyltransferase, partial [Yinghuangia sp. YIM S10712]|uniref:methionyl-tRNA formyltransferase n=1 Tax=Yinghuangia sp. YIM S10712 TaxID=3436930 RepID=UPI003F52C492